MRLRSFIILIVVSLSTVNATQQFIPDEYDDTHDNTSSELNFDETNFCGVSIKGKNLTESLILTNNQSIISGNAFKYNLTCIIDDKHIKDDDKHYTVDLILYGPAKQVKAWGSKYPIYTQQQHQYIKYERYVSFSWNGPTRVMCAVRKYNSLLNKFIDCNRNLYLNINENPLSPTTQAQIAKQYNDEPIRPRISSSRIITSILTTRLFTTEIDTQNMNVDYSEEDDVTMPIVNDVKPEIVRYSSKSLGNEDGAIYKNVFHFTTTFTVLFVFTISFIGMIGLIVYFKYYHRSSSLTIRQLQQPLTDNHKPITITISDKCKTTLSTLEALNSKQQCEHFIDEKIDDADDDDQRTKFI